MKTIGLISISSSRIASIYLTAIDCSIAHKLKGVRSSNIILHRISPEDFLKATSGGKMEPAKEMLTKIAVNLKSCGADCIASTAGIYDRIIMDAKEATDIDIPVIDMASTVSKYCQINDIKKIGIIINPDALNINETVLDLQQHGIKTLAMEQGIHREIDECLCNKHSEYAEDVERVKDLLQEAAECFEKQGAEAMLITSIALCGMLVPSLRWTSKRIWTPLTKVEMLNPYAIHINEIVNFCISDEPKEDFRS